VCGIAEYDRVWVVTALRRGAGSCTIYPLGCGSAIATRDSVESRASDVRGGPGGRRSVGSMLAWAGGINIRVPVGEGVEEGSVA
jgi:hypothetical protein